MIKAMIAVAALAAAASVQSLQDEHATYELLAPETGAIRTVYEVAATTAGATTFVDEIGAGLQPVDADGDGAFDMMTGARLRMDRLKNRFVVHLARPVPPDGGQARIRIVKTYTAAKSYLRQGDAIEFNRSIAIRRTAFVLPAGYRLTSCNVPVQVLADADGRTRLSMMRQGPGAVALVIRAKRDAQTGDAAKPRPLTGARSWEAPPSQGPTDRARLLERAHQDRDIVYFLQQPDTSAFSLYHDYTESREGVGQYLNVVRTGSSVSKPSGKLLDNGDALKVDVLTGSQLQAAGVDAAGERIEPNQQVVVFRFPPVGRGQSVRLRMYETYTAPESYHTDGDELVFDRSFGRPRNSVVLPRGWYLTGLSIPAVVRQTGDGLTRIDFANGRPDSIDVLIKGKRLTAP